MARKNKVIRSLALTAAMAGPLFGFSATASAAAQPPAPEQELVPGTPCTKTARACVDLSEQRAWIIENGKVRYGLDGGVSISHGKPETPTPIGTFHVNRKNKDEVSEEFNNAPMPNAVFFTDKGHAFHQGDVSKGSAGCVRLSKKSSEVFFNLLNPGDEVQIHA